MEHVNNIGIKQDARTHTVTIEVNRDAPGALRHLAAIAQTLGYELKANRTGGFDMAPMKYRLTDSPTMLPNLSSEELVHYAGVEARTPLERALAAEIESMQAKIDELEKLECAG